MEELNLNDLLAIKKIGKLRNQVTELSDRLAESEARSDLFKELLTLKEKELEELKGEKKEEKKKNKSVDSEVK